MGEKLEKILNKGKSVMVGAGLISLLSMPAGVGCEKEDDYSPNPSNYHSDIPNCVWCGYKKPGSSSIYLDQDKCSSNKYCAMTNNGAMCLPGQETYKCNPGSGPYYPIIQEENCVNECVEEYDVGCDEDLNAYVCEKDYDDCLKWFFVLDCFDWCDTNPACENEKYCTCSPLKESCYCDS